MRPNAWGAPEAGNAPTTPLHWTRTRGGRCLLSCFAEMLASFAGPRRDRALLLEFGSRLGLFQCVVGEIDWGVSDSKC